MCVCAVERETKLGGEIGREKQKGRKREGERYRGRETEREQQNVGERARRKQRQQRRRNATVDRDNKVKGRLHQQAPPPEY